MGAACCRGCLGGLLRGQLRPGAPGLRPPQLREPAGGPWSPAHGSHTPEPRPWRPARRSTCARYSFTYCSARLKISLRVARAFLLACSGRPSWRVTPQPAPGGAIPRRGYPPGPHACPRVPTSAASAAFFCCHSSSRLRRFSTDSGTVGGAIVPSCTPGRGRGRRAVTEERRQDGGTGGLCVKWLSLLPPPRRCIARFSTKDGVGCLSAPGPHVRHVSCSCIPAKSCFARSCGLGSCREGTNTARAFKNTFPCTGWVAAAPAPAPPAAAALSQADSSATAN